GQLCDAGCSAAYLIRDNNDAYFAKCQYPADVEKRTDLTDADVAAPSFNIQYAKKIGGQWYFVGRADHFQSPCELDPNSQNPNQAYEDGIRLYIANNLSAL